jgi:hypothetical protein
VWHVADEFWRLGIAVNDFRPLMPCRWSLTGEKEIEQLVRSRTLAQLDVGADGPELIRRVGIPWFYAEAPKARVLEILVERAR